MFTNFHKAEFEKFSSLQEKMSQMTEIIIKFSQIALWNA